MIETFQNHTPSIHKDAWVHDSAVVIGNVQLEKDVSIWPCAVIRGDVENISIDEFTNVQDGSVIHAAHQSRFSSAYSTHIGKYNTIGHQAHLHGCTIENYCLIGSGSIILDGAYIQSFSIIGAGSLVPSNKTLKTGYLYFGSPVKTIRKLNDNEKAHLNYSAKHYKHLKDQYAF